MPSIIDLDGTSDDQKKKQNNDQAIFFALNGASTPAYRPIHGECNHYWTPVAEFCFEKT